MPNEAMLINCQVKIRLGRAQVQPFLRRLRRGLPLRGRTFTVCLTDDRNIRRYNRKYLGRDRPTDVISFPFAEEAKHARRSGRRRLPHGDGNYLGDILISIETARRSARARGRSLRREVCTLIVHGLLHLLGYDHERDNGEMLRKEESLCRRLGLTEARQERR